MCITRSTTRVLRPVGGGSSLSFGPNGLGGPEPLPGEEEQAKPPPRQSVARTHDEKLRNPYASSLSWGADGLGVGSSDLMIPEDDDGEVPAQQQQQQQQQQQPQQQMQQQQQPPPQ